MIPEDYWRKFHKPNLSLPSSRKRRRALRAWRLGRLRTQVGATTLNSTDLELVVTSGLASNWQSHYANRLSLWTKRIMKERLTNNWAYYWISEWFKRSAFRGFAHMWQGVVDVEIVVVNRSLVRCNLEWFRFWSFSCRPSLAGLFGIRSISAAPKAEPGARRASISNVAFTLYTGVKLVQVYQSTPCQIFTLIP